MATALVTGGTGFLGAHVAQVLVEAGHSVRILRRERSPLTLVQDLPVEHAIGDVMDTDSLDRAIQGCDWVFHVAAVADYWRSNHIKLYLVNVNGTVNVFNSAQKNGVRRVTLTSSAAANIRLDGQTAHEDDTFNLPPSLFPYAHSKYLAEQEAARAIQRGLEVVTVCPSVIFGPGDLNQISGSMIVEMAQRSIPVYPTGGVTVIDVRDAAQAHLAAAERGQVGKRYLLGTQDVSYRALFGLIAEVVGKPAPQIPLPPLAALIASKLIGWAARLGVKLPVNADQVFMSSRNIFFDCSAAWRDLGQPTIDVRQSLRDTYDWYQAQGVLARHDSA